MHMSRLFLSMHAQKKIWLSGMGNCEGSPHTHNNFFSLSILYGAIIIVLVLYVNYVLSKELLLSGENVR